MADGKLYGGVLIALDGHADPGVERALPLKGKFPAGARITPLAQLPFREKSWLSGARYWPTPDDIRGLP